MRTQSIDTTPEVERLQVVRIRSFSPARKFASVRSWTHTLTSANLHAARSGTTEPNERDIAVRFVICPLLDHLQAAYTINEQALRDAIAQWNAFSLLHLSSLVKVDAMLPRGTPFDSLVSQRARQLSLIEGYQPIWIASPEDVVLMRLEWYQDCETTADDQWNDILGVS
jgi:hypothetical protein